MSAVRKTITVTPQQDSYIKAQVAAGHYTNDSEYFRDLIRREQDSDIAAIRAALVSKRNRAASRSRSISQHLKNEWQRR